MNLNTCILDSNSSKKIGGALFFSEGVFASVINTRITNTRSKIGGVGYSISNNTVDIDRCIFSNNRADSASLFYSQKLVLTNCLAYNNIADSAYGITGNISLYPRFKIRNCTFTHNKVGKNTASFLHNSNDTIKNTIFWNLTQNELQNCFTPSYSIIKNWTGGGTGNMYLDPLFIDTGDCPYRLSKLSPAIDNGDNSAIDTSLLKYDLLGKKRINNERIDIGAYEYYDSIEPRAPCLLATFDTFEIPSASSLIINCDSIASNGSGYYVSCTHRPITEVSWGFSGQPSDVQIVFDPQTNDCIITPARSYIPGTQFRIRTRVSDPQYSNLYNEKWVTIKITSPGFEICSVSINQNDTSKVFEGKLKSKKNIVPIQIARSRIYLYDDIAGDFSKMQYIDSVIINEDTLPKSRGGDNEYGSYSFALSSSSRVMNANGVWTGKTLFQWATDSTSRWNGSLYYRKNHTIRFLVNITNSVDGVKKYISNVAADFDGPLTSMYVVNHPYSQDISWAPFKEKLKSLSLYIIPEGENAPEGDTIVFTGNDLDRLSYTANNLQDSRMYNYLLFAEDLHGNTAQSQARSMTTSGLYTISGYVDGQNFDSTVKVQLLVPSFLNYKTVIRDTIIAADSRYAFNDLPNGIYSVQVQSPIPTIYNALPYEITDTLLREDDTALNFVIAPRALIAQDGVQIQQIPGSGDLEFTITTNKLFINERPDKILLKWEGGDTTVDTGSQMFTVYTYSETADTNGNALWQFTIPRAQIEDSILNRGKKGFDINVRYIESELYSRNDDYQSFRNAKWSYPFITDTLSSDSLLLFAGQTFKCPQKPNISPLMASAKDIKFWLRAAHAGPSLKAVTRLESLDGLDTATKEYKISNVTTPFSDKWIARQLDWNYTSDLKNVPNGLNFLSGIKLNGTKVAAFSGKRSDTSQTYASWKVRIPEKTNYNLWVYVEDTIRQSLKFNAEIIGDSSVSMFLFDFKLKKGEKKKPGWYKAGSHALVFEDSDAEVKIKSQAVPLIISTFALVSTKISASLPNDSVKTRALAWGDYIPLNMCGGYSLKPDTYYKTLVYTEDRYGNKSDSIIDTIRTKDVFDSSTIAIYQETGTGNLVMTFADPGTENMSVDSVIFHFDGSDYPVKVNKPLEAGKQTDVIITRDELKRIIPITSFQRHTKYDSLYVVFVSDSSYTITLNQDYDVNSCSECATACQVKTSFRKVWSWKLRNFGYHTVTTQNYKCLKSTDVVYHDTISSGRISAVWPDLNKPLVASQEYRYVTTPKLDSVLVTSRTISILCNNLNTTFDGNRKEQMSGNVIVKWKPGSLCADSTMDTLAYGNRFTIKDNWITFMPSFEGSISSSIGAWRQNGTLGTRHQWLDNSGSDTIGGEFYPNIGITLNDTDIIPSDTSRHVNNGIPSLSTGIYLTAAQASSSPSDKFHLWVLPSKENNATSRYFYWGIDGVPITTVIGDAECTDSNNLQWKAGPQVYLDSGIHTIDIFMKDDGVGIAGIALSKESAVPSFTVNQLSRWGNSGFDLKVNAIDLASNKSTTFSAVATDRFGNVSAVGTKVLTTKPMDIPIPGVVIAPQEPLQNKFYKSLTPAFTLTLNNSFPDMVDIETQLVKNHNGSSDSVSRLVIRRTDSLSNMWFAEVDSLIPLLPFPDAGAVTNAESYAIRARAVLNNGKSGDWTQLIFGVIPDTSEVMPSIELQDSSYSISSLHFCFNQGYRIATNVLIGDLEIVFNFSDTNKYKLMLENATIYTDTALDSSGTIIHQKIDSISGGVLASYSCDSYDETCSKEPLFTFPYGKYTITAKVDSLSLNRSAGITKILGKGMMITDDNNNGARISRSPVLTQDVGIVYQGVVDTFYTTKDRFFVKNVVTFSKIHNGFNLDACKTMFTRGTGTDSAFYMLLAGACETCGPDLTFSVLNPVYLDNEFSAFDKLRDPVRISYQSGSSPYVIDFSSGSNAVDNSNCKGVTYGGWKLNINSYDFNAQGITLNEFSVGLNEEQFPEKNSNKQVIPAFHGVKVKGDTTHNNGALHFYDGAIASGTNIEFSTVNDYVFKNAPQFSFVQKTFNEYVIKAPQGCQLATPTWKNKDFCESDDGDITNDTVHVFVKADSGLVIAKDGIASLIASGPFERTIGKIGNGSGSALTIRGRLNVSFAARDFQLKLTNDSNSLIIVNPGYFNHRENQPDSIKVAKASIGLFSDFSINTLYGKQDDGKRYEIIPNQFDILKIPSNGFDIFKTSGTGPAGIRILLLAPELNLSSIGELFNTRGNGCSYDASIYNAGFDLNRNLTNISGRIDLPDSIGACFGVSGMGKIQKELASLALKSIYLGLDKSTNENQNDTLTIGTDAVITLGEKFKNIGLENERIKLNKFITGYEVDRSWFIKELHASAFELPRLIGIGPKNYSEESSSDDKQLENDKKAGKNYVELYTGGNGFSVDYVNDKTLKLQMNNWTLRITDTFPIVPLRGISLLLKNFTYEKDVEGDDNGRITAIDAAAEYIPPDKKITIGDFGLCNARIGVRCVSEKEAENKTSVNAYLYVAFDTLQIGDKKYIMRCGDGGSTEMKIYFDGRFNAKGCLVWKDTIGIVPWGEKSNPDIFIDPKTPNGNDPEIAFEIDSKIGFKAGLRNVRMKSKPNYKLPVLDTVVDVLIDTLDFGVTDKKLQLYKLDIDWFIYKQVLDNDAFKLAINKVEIGYNGNRKSWGDSTALDNKFYIIAEPDFKFKLSKYCENSSVKPSLGLIVDTKKSAEEQKKAEFIWKVNSDFDCKIGGLAFGAEFKLTKDTIGFNEAYLQMGELEQYGMVKLDKTARDSVKSNKFQNLQAGVLFRNVYWIKDSTTGYSWKFNPHKTLEFRPLIKVDYPFEICGAKIQGTFNFERLFDSPHPGIGYENISIQMPEKLGNAFVKTGFSLYIDGQKPYIHPEYDKPGAISFGISGIEITDEIELGEARLELGVDKPAGLDYEAWYLRGVASMNIAPVLDNITVDIAFEKPHPWENITGIRHAKLKIKLNKACRIAIGTTPFFIAGFEGALYDGSGMPEGAIACGIPGLSPGLKVEAAILLEFEEPTVVNGKIGFWMHLYRLNFGINGEVTALEGIADADACAAIYNNGQAFHGHFLVMIHLGLAAKGRFVVDVWRDTTGGNFTADATCAIGLERGALIKTRLIKVPRKTKWFFELFTRAGKFQGNHKGITTGVRFFGKSWGLGVIDKKFKIGNVGKLKLKQAPVVIAALPASANAYPFADENALMDYYAAPNSLAGENAYTLNDDYELIDPGFNFDGDEIISLVAASDSGTFVFPDEVLRVADSNNNWDMDQSNYLAVDTVNDLPVYFLNEENTVGRVWANNKRLKKIKIAMPKKQENISFDYLFSAGLKPANIALHAEEVEIGNSVKIKFTGKVENFQGNLRTLTRTKDDGTVDTLFRRKMNLKLFSSSIGSRPADTVQSERYLYNFIDIPISQFDGYTAGDTSLLQNDYITYDSVTHTIIIDSINGLQWNTMNSGPGKFAFRASVEDLDFVVEDGNGGKVIVPESMPDSASVFTNPPVVLGHPGSRDTLVITVKNQIPITKPEGFTATSSSADTNWIGENEKRSIFLRWKQVRNPALRGYEISWSPTGHNGEHRHTAIIGSTNHYTITIPELDPNMYTPDSLDAAGEARVVYRIAEIDTNEYYLPGDSLNHDKEYQNSNGNTVYLKRMFDLDTVLAVDSVIPVRPNRTWGESVDTVYCKADKFDVVITPVIDSLVTVIDSNWRETGTIKEEQIVKSALLQSLADTVKNVQLGVNRGSTTRNKFTIGFISDSSNQALDTVEVPLNTGTIVKTAIITNNIDTSSVDPSSYGELYAKVMDSIADNQKPGTGLFDTWFDVTRDTLFTNLSFRPVEKDMTCKEMYSNTCSKVKLDATGTVHRDEDGKITDTIYSSCASECEPSNPNDSTCEDCDPNSPNNKLSRMDPCNGKPNSLVYEKTPFGTYKVNVYAINNGQRGRPVPDGTAGPVVYDSLFFKVVPPKPVLHGVSPRYVLSGRNDSLSLAVSGLWLDTNAALQPQACIQWTDLSGRKQEMRIDLEKGRTIIPMHADNNNVNWQLSTSADWEAKVSTGDLLIDADGEIQIAVSIINRDTAIGGSVIECRSNDFSVAFVSDPAAIECPDYYYDSDWPNAAYLMKWIGNYPKDPSPGDTMYVRFTELHDIDEAKFNINLIRNKPDGSIDTIPINNYKVEYDGVSVIIPNDIAVTVNREWRLVTNLKQGENNPCKNKWWGQDTGNSFRITPQRAYDIRSYNSGFKIELTKGRPEDRHLDIVEYGIGYDPASPGVKTSSYRHYPEPQLIQMSHSDWVTATIKDKNGGNERTIRKWIEIKTIPQLVYTNGEIVPDHFIAIPGDTVIIKSPVSVFTDPAVPEVQNCYSFAECAKVCGMDTIVINSMSKSPLTIERQTSTANGYGKRQFTSEGVREYTFTIKTPAFDSIALVTIPSANLSDAISMPLTGYPLLMRIDTSIVKNIDLFIQNGFHFRNSAMIPLPYEVEKIDTVDHEILAWVKTDTLNPGIGNNSLYIVAGPNMMNSARNVWSSYNSVWHCTSDTLFKDVTQKGHDISARGIAVIHNGVISSATGLTGSLNVQSSSILNVNNSGLSIGAWFYFDSLPSSGVEVFKFKDLSNKVWFNCAITADSAVMITIDGDTLKTISGAIEDNTWIQIAATYNTNGNGSIFVNGLEVARKLMNGGERIRCTEGSLSIGSGGVFPGIIDEIRTAPINWSPSWIALDYFSQRKRNDFMKVPSGMTSITRISNPHCQLVRNLQTKDLLFAGNSQWELSSVPFDYLGSDIIKMPWADKANYNDSVCTITLNGKAKIAVLFDSRYNRIPQYLESYQKENDFAEVVNRKTGESQQLVIYSKEIDSGTVSFGSSKTEENYGGEFPGVILINTQENTGFKVIASNYPSIRTCKSNKKGSLLFTDREYEIDSLPGILNNSVMIRMPNAYRFSDSLHAAVSVNRGAKVHLLLDSLYTSWPSSISGRNWYSETEKVRAGNIVYSIVSRTIDSGVVTLPAPRSNGGSGNRFNYALFVSENKDTTVVKNLEPATNHIGILDTGMLVYTDTNLTAAIIPEKYRNMTMIRTRLGDFTSRDSALLHFSLERNVKAYVALDVHQKILPSFLTKYDKETGGWAPTGNTITLNDGSAFTVWRKYLHNGTYSFEGARYNGDTSNTRNYFMFFDQSIIPDTPIIVDNGIVGGKIKIGENVFIESNVSITYKTPDIPDGIIIKTKMYVDRCDTVRIQLGKPARIWLFMDPAFRTQGTFIEYDNWEAQHSHIGLSGNYPDRNVWTKTYNAGLVSIPGIHCDYKQGNVMNYVIGIEYMESPVKGYRNNGTFTVRGIGNERCASSGDYRLKNVDIVYAYQIGMSSQSWRMNVKMTNPTEEVKDTVYVLSLNTDTTVYTGNSGAENGSGVVSLSPSLSLSDLIPVLVNADSVQVNAIDLSAKGIVRIAFKNSSSVPVSKQFTVVLFEDLNGDYQYNKYNDRFLGRAIVNGIKADEYLLYQIPVNDTLSFPGKTMFAFIDGEDWIDEQNEWNNVKASSSVCDNYIEEGRRGEWVIERQGDWESSDTAVFCYLDDNNKDSAIDENDSLYILYTYDYRMHCINAITRDSLFTSVTVNSNFVKKLYVNDFNGDGVPEIIIGNKLYNNKGMLLFDASTFSSSLNQSFDFNRDGNRDSIAVIDSCITIWSGKDTSLLYVNPINRWEGRQWPVTVGVLADISEGLYDCYDVNVSFPRYSVTMTDTVDLTVRVGNVGSVAFGRGVSVKIYADTLNGDSEIERLGDVGIRIGEKRTGALKTGQFEDIKIQTKLPANTKRVWFVVDEENRYFECEEENNVLMLMVGN